MAFLSWHDRYLLGHPELDAQHQLLFELVNHYDDVVQMRLPDEPSRILEDLIQTAEGHFRYEEAVMAECGYPDQREHQRTHEELIHQLRQMAGRLRATGHGGSRSVIRFLVDWLTNHLMREDQALRPYLRL